MPRSREPASSSRTDARASRPRVPELVVLGASAGSVQALLRLLPRLPAGWAPCMVVVTHVPERPRSELASLFAEKCVVPVTEAEDKTPLAPGTILFAPAGYHTLVEPAGTVSLSLEAPEHHSRPSIDALFDSAAWAYRERLLGVLLTGANSDGALGLLQIRRAGGRTWVQDPATAFAPEMPASAVACGAAEAVLDLDTLIARLSRFTRSGPSGAARIPPEGGNSH